MRWWEEWLRPRVIKWVLVALGVVALLVWPGFLRLLVQRLTTAASGAALELAPLRGPVLGLVITVGAIWLMIRSIFRRK